MLKVQCISRECGFYHELKLGQWYVVEEERIIEETKTSYWGIITESSTGYFPIKHYPKKLFRTLDERRDSKLNKILREVE